MSAAGSDARAHAVDADAGGVRRRQLLVFSVLTAALLVALALWLGLGSGKAPPVSPSIDAELAGPDTAEEAWTRRSEARIGTIEARLREMETDARRLGAENERLREKLAVDAADARAVIDRQAAMIDDLEQFVSEGLPAVAVPGETPMFPGAAGDPAHGPGDGLPLVAPPAPLIETFELDDPSPGASAIEAWKPLSTWLPAGSHAEAVVLAGVDASAGISSQGDPRPLLLRLIGPAWTAAADGSALQVDVAGCTVTGAAHGDLSSEKVYARLRTLTCAGPEPGSVIETEVAGFIAGSGKTGVRGPVVSREGALVQKAFLAGLVSGAGQGAAQAFQPQAVATGGGDAAVANTGLMDIGRAGLGAGAASAGQKVADYLIRRAEQYQPVIQLRSGTRVSVVFLEGARLDGGLLDGQRNTGEIE
ncbi:MAG: TraB/VirB10 family protein [Rhodospirillales bacterium]|nr:TraB/VirB10 family protein [Rhodospirillales bacterium]